VIRCFSGFPAVSLPCPRFDLKIACKALIMNDFSMQSELRKKFSPEFPVVAGKGRGGATLPSFRPFGGAAASGSGVPVSFFCGRPRPAAKWPLFVRTGDRCRGPGRGYLYREPSGSGHQRAIGDERVPAPTARRDRHRRDVGMSWRRGTLGGIVDPACISLPPNHRATGRGRQRPPRDNR
jgi:hypothetical protein